MPRVSLVIALAVLVAAAAFVWWTDQPAVRYAFVRGGWQCSVQQFVNLPRDVDMIAIGSSRVRAGLDLNMVAARSGGQVSQPYNFSRTGRSPMRNYVIFRDIVERGTDLKFAYVEIDTAAFADTTQGQPLAVDRDVGFQRYGDILQVFHAFADRPVLERAHNIAAQSLKKIGDSIVFLFSGRIAEANSQNGEPAPHVCWREYYNTKTAGKTRRIEKQKADYEATFGDLWVAESDTVKSFRSRRAVLEAYYFGLVRDLARKHGIKLVTSRHWRAYEPPLTAASLAELKLRFPEFIYPEADFVRSTWADFLDATHMFAGSRERFSHWFADQLFAQEAAE